MRKGSEGKGAMPISGHGNTHGPRAGRGDNHAGRRAAIALALLALPTLAVAQATDDPLIQRGVPAEATAENAVVARDRALASGQRIAYDRMALALGLPRNLSDSQIEAAVASLVIESERITPRGYSARITVNFRNPGAVARLPAAPPTPGAPPATGPVVASIEATARYRSLGEFAELSRRLSGSPAVMRAELLTVSGEAARWRLALRSQPNDAAAELANAGIYLGQGDPRANEGWRLALGRS